MSKSPVWILDTDAGVDDAVAMLVALNEQGLRWAGITTVAGNTDVDRVTANVGHVLDLTGKDIAIYRGSAHPFFQQPVRSEAIMAADGLGGASASLPPVRHLPCEGHAVFTLPDLVRSASAHGDLTVVALGPLTNIALLARLAPDVVPLVKRLVIMGGTLRAQGNSTPIAEFNFYCDPDAAAVVLNAGFADMWLLPWEVSVDQPLPWDQYDALCQRGTRKAEFFRLVTHSLAVFLRETLHTAGYPLPDLLAAAVAANPSLAVEGRHVRVDVDARPGIGYGQLVIDWMGISGQVVNGFVVTAVNAESIYRMLDSALND